MKCNIVGFMRNISRPGTEELQQELLDNLKELRDHPEKHGEFFDLYLFRDDNEWRAAKSVEQPANGELPSQPGHLQQGQEAINIEECLKQVCADVAMLYADRLERCTRASLQRD